MWSFLGVGIVVVAGLIGYSWWDGEPGSKAKSVADPARVSEPRPLTPNYDPILVFHKQSSGSARADLKLVCSPAGRWVLFDAGKMYSKVVVHFGAQAGGMHARGPTYYSMVGKLDVGAISVLATVPEGVLTFEFPAITVVQVREIEARCNFAPIA